MATKAKKTARKNGKKSLASADLAKVAGGFLDVNVHAQTTVAAAGSRQTNTGNNGSNNNNVSGSYNVTRNRNTSNSNNLTSNRNSNNVYGNSVNVGGSVFATGNKDVIKF